MGTGTDMQFAIFAQLIGSLMQNGQQQQALAARQQAANLFGDDILPQLDRMVAIQLPPEQISRWTQATAATQGQGQALSALESEVAAKGETPEDRAAFLNARNRAQGVANSQQGNIMRSLAARGLAGTGAGLAAQESAAQQGATMANEADVQNAADSRRRYLSAVQGLASTAGQIRGQEMQAMSAQDALNEFNINNAMATQQYNLNLPLTEFNAKMQVRQGKANALGGVANQFNQIGQTYGNQGQGVATGLATYAQQPQANQQQMGEPQGPVPSYQPPPQQQTYSQPSDWEAYVNGGVPEWDK